MFADEEIPLIAQDGVWKYLDDGTGSIDPAKFRTWLFGDLETVTEMRMPHIEDLENEYK